MAATRGQTFLPLLHREVGMEKIKEKLKTSFKKLKIATHYGAMRCGPASDPV